MRVVIQRVSHASVTIEGVCKSAIKEGFMILEVVNCVSGLYELIINIGAVLSEDAVICVGKLQAINNVVKKQ